MTTGVQLFAITAFLLWGLVSSVSGVLLSSADEAQLIWRERTPQGWRSWRPVHYGLTTADLRVLQRGGDRFSADELAGLLDTVLAQARRANTDAVQFAVLLRSPEGVRTPPAVVFVSEIQDVVTDSWEVPAGAG